MYTTECDATLQTRRVLSLFTLRLPHSSFSRATSTSALVTFQREQRKTRCVRSVMIYSNITSYWVTSVQGKNKKNKNTTTNPNTKRNLWYGFFFSSSDQQKLLYTVHPFQSHHKQLTQKHLLLFHISFSPFLAQMCLVSTFKIMEQTRMAHNFTKKKEKPNEIVNISFNKPL